MAHMEVFFVEFWPKNKQATLTFIIMCMLIDPWVPWSSSPGHWMDAERHMAHHWLTCMVEHWTGAAWDNVMKNNIEFGWTWESNPGPSNEQTRHQPLHHRVVFVIIMASENNIQNINYAGKLEKGAHHIWINQSCSSTYCLLHLFLQNKEQVAGVLNPHKMKRPKIAIGPVCNINWAR